MRSPKIVNSPDTRIFKSLSHSGKTKSKPTKQPVLCFASSLAMEESPPREFKLMVYLQGGKDRALLNKKLFHHKYMLEIAACTACNIRPR